ncbi:hypothetical protein AVEN_86563-1 [Araneus ventricosus]|uniref:Uncharacterized protein n=1 Tax=Araneus ventricosus TaxID=182803 RepID=A0A4Y2SUP4_ARAVE|nr:hypothetical protein AVEN_86563-1 [Araneus ventricosus]
MAGLSSGAIEKQQVVSILSKDFPALLGCLGGWRLQLGCADFQSVQWLHNWMPAGKGYAGCHASKLIPDTCATEVLLLDAVTISYAGCRNKLCRMPPASRIAAGPAALTG